MVNVKNHHFCGGSSFYAYLLISTQDAGINFCACRKINFTKITEGNLSAFVYRLFHEDFAPIIGKTKSS